MVQSKYHAIIESLSKKVVFKAAEAREAGIPSRMLSHFCRKGVIKRISRGVYMGCCADLKCDFQWEDLALIAMTIPQGVICQISALCFYELTDQIMREFWIAVPHSTRKLKRPNTRIIRTRNIHLGQTEVSIGNHVLKIFDRERTIIDAFLYLSKEIALKALKSYLFSSKKYKPDLRKLTAYAKQLRININPYILSLTT